MTKYAKLVFETEVTDERPEMLVNKLKTIVQRYIIFMQENPMLAIQDIDISDKSFDRRKVT